MERKDLNRIKMVLVEKHRTFDECHLAPCIQHGRGTGQDRQGFEGH